MTGDTKDACFDRQAELDDVLAEFLPSTVPRDSPSGSTVPRRHVAAVDLVDEELLERAIAAKNGADFEALWRGTWEDRYPSHSEADLALCAHLAFWTDRDLVRIDRLFRASGLMRDKWDEPRGQTTYGAQTIEKAIAATSETYRPGASSIGTHPGTHPVEGASPEVLGGSPSQVRPCVPYVSRDAPGTDAPSPPGSDDEPGVFEFENAAEFAAVDEPSADAVLGSDDDAAAVAGGTLVIYGAGGAGKSTIGLDMGVHMSAGSGWLGLDVPKPVRFLVVENDGPRGRFRRKVRAKLAAWDGQGPGDRLVVLKNPWGATSLAREDHRHSLAAYIRDHEVDVLLAGPIVSLGMIGGGTPDEVSAFERHLAALRDLVGRPLAVWLIHHQNVRGQISGAWDRVPDTLIRIVAAGNGHTRLTWQKARDSSTLHGTSWKLKWADGMSFEIDDTPDVTEADIEAGILEFAAANPGTSWNPVDKAVKGNAGTKRQVRDRLIADSQLVNRGKGKAFALWNAEDLVDELDIFGEGES